MNSLLVSSLDIDDVITSVKELDTRKIYMVKSMLELDALFAA